MDSTHAYPVPRSLAPDEVHVWLVYPDALCDSDLLTAYHSLMNAAEREKCSRFHFERGRRECLVTRALVRTTLSRYVRLAPAAWIFEHNEHGQPAVVAGQCPMPFRFNLSHTEGLIACAVTLNHDVGIDVETTDRRGETVAIADRYFSRSEVAALRQLPERDQRQRFFDYWTLKEAYIKARGLGLAIPLDQFSLHLNHPDPITVSFDPRLGDDASSWQFALSRATPRHPLALAIRRGAGRDCRIQVATTVPLRD